MIKQQIKQLFHFVRQWVDTYFTLFDKCLGKSHKGREGEELVRQSEIIVNRCLT